MAEKVVTSGKCCCAQLSEVSCKSLKKGERYKRTISDEEIVIANRFLSERKKKTATRKEVLCDKHRDFIRGILKKEKEAKENKLLEREADRAKVTAEMLRNLEEKDEQHRIGTF